MASSTGEQLVDLRQGLIDGGRFGGWWGEAQGDATGHRLLVDELAAVRPDDGVLSEEGHDDGARLDHDRVWIVDPLDGSADFGRGSGDWAVHVALTQAGRGVAAAVALPSVGTVFSTALAPSVPARQQERPVVVTGRSRAHDDGVAVAQALDADLVTCGSAGVKAMLVVMGKTDVYVHGGPLWEWDVCAPAIVARAAGLHVSDRWGEDLVFNKPDPVSPGLVVCRPDFADTVLRAL